MLKRQINLKQEIESFLWPEEAVASKSKQRALSALRVLYATVLDFSTGQLSLRAMSLVYTTLLSIVPLLALSFSVLKAMGAHNEVEPFLYQFLAPLGDKGVEIGQNMIGFIDNIKVGVLGSVGLGLLIYTVLSLVQKIEKAFNMIWHVHSTRTLGERFSSYLSVIMIGPVLMVSALGLTATVMNSSVVTYLAAIEPFGSLIIMATKLIPYLMVMAVFAFIYMFVPNTRVHFKAALCGAIIAGFLWETSGLLFARFVANSTNYTAVYSSFAIVIMLLIWLYISWSVLLLGSSIAFYVQNPSAQKISRDGFEMSNRFKERLALVIVQQIAKRHLEGGEPISVSTLVDTLRLPDRVLNVVLKSLVDQGVLIVTQSDPVGYVPAKSIHEMTVSDVLSSIRLAEEERYLSAKAIPIDQTLDRQLNEIEQAVEQALLDKKVIDLL